MLDPRDRAFLDHAVRTGRLPRSQADDLAARFSGPAGTLSQALVSSGRIDRQSAEQMWREITSGSGSGRLAGPTPGSARFAPGTTPGSARFAPGTTPGSARTPSASGRLQRFPQIPGYLIDEELGRGGMGAVYRATHEESGERVAIKILLRSGERQIARFEREVEALRRLDHPAVVRLIGSGIVAGNPYLAMEYLRGGDLETAFEQKSIGRQQGLRIVAQVARALDQAHGLGVLHRDLKPANILLDEEGQPKVTDFGLAKILDRETQLTKTNAALGTPYYMAPEQVRGADYTSAVDVYGLGVILYQLLTDAYPFDGADKVELFSAILGRPPKPPWEAADVPKDLGHLVLWAMEKIPTDRPSCAELADLLEAHLRGERLHVRPPSLRRGRLKIAAGALVTAAVVFGLGAAILSSGREAPSPGFLDPEQAQALKQAAATARRARAGRELEDLLAELRAHEAVEDRLRALTEAQRPAGEALVARSRERHGELIDQVVPLLVEAKRAEDAGELARRLVVIRPGPASALVLAGVLAMDPAGRVEAMALLRPFLSKPPADPELLASLARTLLALHRPQLAALALDGAPPSLSALRARARLRAGDLSGAQRDALAAAEAHPDDASAACLRARVELAGGVDPAKVLEDLDRLPGGADSGWHAARALALGLQGRPGAARTALHEAATLDPGTYDAEIARRLLRRGHRKEGEVRLRALVDAGRGDAAIRLDLALASWLAGAPDAATVASLDAVAGAAAAFGADPETSAAAARWLATVEVARGGLAAAEAAARKAWELSPSAQSAATLAWVLWRAGQLDAARQALAAGPPPSSVEGVLLRGRLALSAGDLTQAAAAAAALPAGHPGRASLELELAKRQGGDPAQVTARTQALDLAWRLAVPGRATPSPVASAPEPTPRTAAIRRLLHEITRRVGLVQRSTEARETVQLLARRALALDREVWRAQVVALELAEDLAGLGRLIDEHPTLLRARRARVSLVSAKANQGQTIDHAKLRADLLAMAPHRAQLTDSEQIAIARSFQAEGDPQRGFAYLQPLLARESPRSSLALLAGVTLADQLGDPLAATLRAKLAEIRQTRLEERALLQQAYYGEDQTGLPRALQALRRLERDLPHSWSYWNFRAQAYLGEGRFGKSLVCGAEYLSAFTHGLRADNLSLWLHAFGWNPQVREELVDELTRERIAQRPWEPVPWIARGMFHSSRYNLHPTPDPEDLEAATDYVLYALELSPQKAGFAALAANLLVTLEANAEAEELIELALTLDPQCEFATFQRARLAASRGDVPQTISLLQRIQRLTHPKITLQLRQDPIFAKIRDNAAFKEFLGSLTAR